MSCEKIDLGNGQFAIICGLRSKPRPCQFCGRASSKQCDFPMGDGKTCDAYMCGNCAHSVGTNRDYCPTHQANTGRVILPRKIADWPAEWRERYEERAGIMEFEGNLPRAMAERRAEEDMRRIAAKGA
jgi:hypothetical protein